MNIKPTKRQRQAVDNILSGDYRSVAEAMRAAGYSEKSSYNPKHTLANRKGVQNYIESLSDSAQKRWNMSLDEKVMDVYLDGLDAIKLHGKKGIEHPDYKMRLEYANKVTELLSWLQN